MNTDRSKIASNRNMLDLEMLELADFIGPVVGAGVISAIQRNAMTLDDLSDEARRNIDSIDDVIYSKDLSLLLRVILDSWEVAFENAFTPHGVTYPLVDKVRRIRNDFSHNTGNYSNDSYVADSLKAIKDLHSGIRSAMPTGSNTKIAGETAHNANSTSNSVASFFNQGNIYFERGLWDLAIANFTSAVNLNRNHAEAWNRRGESHFMKNQYDLATSDYDRAIQIDANCARYWLHRGWAYHQRGLYAPDTIWDIEKRGYVMDQGNVWACHTKGISDITNAINLDPSYHTAWHNRGWLFLNTGNYYRAVEDNTRALEIDSSSHATWNNRGVAYRYLKKWKEAEYDFDQALSIDPNYQLAIANKSAAISARRMHRLKKAFGVGVVALVVIVIAVMAL